MTAAISTQTGRADCSVNRSRRSICRNSFIALYLHARVVVSVAAVRIGAVDMGIGNIFGSNIFNIFILFIDDVFFLQGPLLSSVNPVHVIPGLAAILMSAVSIIGLAYKSCGKRMFWGQDSLVMMLIFIISTTLLYYQDSLLYAQGMRYGF